MRTGNGITTTQIQPLEQLPSNSYITTDPYNFNCVLMSFTFNISGDQVEVEVRPPSLANRQQFGTILAQITGSTPDNINISDTFFWELNEDELKSLVKACSDISFRQKNELDLNEEGNWGAAVNLISEFFLTSRKTMESKEKSSKPSNDSSSDTSGTTKKET